MLCQVLTVPSVYRSQLEFAFGGDCVPWYASPVLVRDGPGGAVVVFMDASSIAGMVWERWRYNAVRFLVLSAVLSLIAWLLVRVSITRPMAKMTLWTQALRRGQVVEPLELSDTGLFGPMAQEVTVLARSLHRAQAAAEEEAALRLTGETLWTYRRDVPDRLSLCCGMPNRGVALLGRTVFVATIDAYLGKSETRAELAQFGLTTMGGAPAKVSTMIAADRVKWGEIIKAQQITVTP